MKNNLLFIVLLSLFPLMLFSQDVLPSMKLEALDGTQTELSSISANDQLVIISLWATWCVPCKNELDAINEVYQDWQDETKVKLYAVSIDDARTVNRVKPLVNGKGWDFKVLLDTNSDLKRKLNAPSIPLTLLVKNNKIVYRHSGYTPGSEDELFKKIKEFSK